MRKLHRISGPPPPNHLTHPWAVDVYEDQINKPGPCYVGCFLFKEKERAESYAAGYEQESLTHATVRPSKPDDKEFA